MTMYNAFNKDLEDRYIQMLMTNTVGNTFDVSQRENVDTALDIHRAILAKDPVFMAKAAIYARENGYTRLQPIIALAYLSTVPKGQKNLFYNAFDRVILTPNNLFDFVQVASRIRQGKGFGRALKTAIGNWYNNLSEYHVMKYGADSKVDKAGEKTFDMKDLLRLVRPIPNSRKQKELFKYILDKEVDFNVLPQLAAYESLKKETDMSRVRELIRQARIPHEVATGAISKPDLATWTAIMKEMPIFALLRNLNTLQRHGVLDNVDNRQHVISVFTNEQAILRSKILPYRFLTAYEQFTGWEDIRGGLRTALNLSFKNVPDIFGTTHVSIDKSGSMNGDRMKHASIFGVATYMKAPDSELTMFDTLLYDTKLDKNNSLMTNVQKLPGASGGTAISLPVQHLLGTVKDGQNNVNSWLRTHTGYHPQVDQGFRRNEPTVVDNIVIITDEQQNTGSPLVIEFEKYRETVNPDAKLFIINVAGHQGYTIPKDSKNVFYIFGWSDQVLNYVSYVSHGFAGQRQHVEAVELNKAAVTK